ncbi:branched-chain-amino-acid aminotransferase 3, chloroplastic-like isoform X4 [Ananas comosus]|uniref:Branched-chain-amino-acid aminotransferase n=1 Tax=Ananas comosus TaxID=4615 RepID=A0A6P5FE22_ANACO|nr:branched-chain-amino-acid aminotransferase 3, chloroplastic-like isoform X4 [Ananas comosus]
MDRTLLLHPPRAYNGALLIASSPYPPDPFAHRARRPFSPSSSSSPSPLKIQNQILPMSLSLEASSTTRCEASLSNIYNTDADIVDLDWENLGFGLVPTDYMYMMKCSSDGIFTKGELLRFGPIELSPSSGVLNYGQGLFEGLKAYRKEDGSVLLFRPEENALRMKLGAERMCMPSPTVEQFVDAVKLTVLANKRWVLKAQNIAKEKGYSDVLYLDSVHKKYLEEVSSCNVFIVKDNVIATPALKGTILPGITRKSIIDVARGRGYQVEERLVSVEELLDADEVFCTGTAVVVSPVGIITYLGKRMDYGNQGVGVVAQQLYSSLTSLQMGLVEDTMGWTLKLN